MQTVYVFSEDIGMEFGLKKCGALGLKRGKVVKMDGGTLPDGQAIKRIDEDGYRYLGIIKVDSVKEGGMKIQCQKEYKRRLKMVLKSKLNGKNNIQGINTWAVAVIRAGIIK